MKYQPERYDNYRDYYPQADLDKLAVEAVADWTAQRKEPGVVPAGNTSSVNTGEIVSRVTRNWSKHHE